MKPNKKYTKKQLKAFEKDAEPIESSATDINFLAPSPEKYECECGEEVKANGEHICSEKQDWAVEFDNNCRGGEDSFTKNGFYHMPYIKQFIQKTLSSQREEVIEECIGALPKGMSDEYNDFQVGFNQCLEEVKIKLNKLKNKNL